MIKRILTLTLAILMVVSTAISVSAEDVTAETISAVVELTEAEKFFIGIGAVDGEKYISDAIPTRAEFAEFLVKVANLHATATDETVIFVDVPATHANYSAIKEVYSQGLMGGVGDSKFAPDYNIVLNQAIKVLVDLMDYTPFAKREGGYPGGYLTVAGKLELLKNISGVVTDDATYRNIMQIFYNALDVEVQALTGATYEGVIYGGGGKTFSEAVLKLKKVEGRITDNGFTSLTGASKVSKNKMIIGNVTVDISDELIYPRDYIGMDVDAYYRIVEEDEKPLVYVSLDRNRSITFDLSDYVSITQSSVTYYNGNKKVTKNLAKGFTMIYNGKIFDPIIPSALKGLTGEMTLVSANSGVYDLVVVNSYENIFVGSIDKAEKIIYNGIKYKSQYQSKHKTKLDFSNRNTYDFLNVVTYDGLQSTFDKIRQGDVISAKISRDGRVVTLVVEREFTETFAFESYETSDDVCKISDGKNTYDFPEFNKLLLPDLVKGQEYTVHFNKFGDVVWVEAKASEYPIGFLVDTYKEGRGKKTKYQVRLYTQDNDFVILNIGEKVYYNNFRKKTEDIFDEIKTYIGAAVLYEADEGILNRIVMPEDLGVESNRGWYRISPIAYGCQADSGLDDSAWAKHQENVWSAVGEWRHVGDKFAFVEGTTVGMYIPDKIANYGNDSGYGIYTSSIKRYVKCAIEGYSREFNDVIADLEVRKVDTSGMVKKDMEMFLVSKITTKANKDGEPIKAFKGYKTSYWSNGVIQASYYEPSDGAVTVSGCSMNSIDDISVGDILMFAVNGDGEFQSIEVCYDYDTGNSENPTDNNFLDKGYIYSSGNDWTRTTTTLPEELDMTNADHYLQTVGRHHRNSSSVILVTEYDGELLFDIATVADLKSYTKTYGEYDYLVSLRNGEDSVFGSVAYRSGRD